MESLVQLTRWHFSTILGQLGRHARLRTPTAPRRKHGLAGSIVSSPAMMTCVCRRNRKALWS